MNRRNFFRGILSSFFLPTQKATPILQRKEGISVGDVWKIEGTDVTVMVLQVKDDGVTTRYDLIRNYYR